MKNNIDIVKDLKDIKKADLKKQVFIIIQKWRKQMKTNKKEFKEEFLDNNKNQYFNALKDLIGEFEELKEMSVLNFLFLVICGGSNIKLLKEMNEEFEKSMEKKK